MSEARNDTRPVSLALIMWTLVGVATGGLAFAIHDVRHLVQVGTDCVS